MSLVWSKQNPNCEAAILEHHTVCFYVNLLFATKTKYIPASILIEDLIESLQWSTRVSEGDLPVPLRLPLTEIFPNSVTVVTVYESNNPRIHLKLHGNATNLVKSRPLGGVGRLGSPVTLAYPVFPAYLVLVAI